jgi:hypothetical protein
MATVRFSQALIDDILVQAKSKLQPAVTRAFESRPDHSWGDKIYNTLFADELHLVKQLPSYWCKEVDHVHVDYVGGMGIEMKFNLSAPRPWPVAVIDTDLAHSNSYFAGRIALKNHLVWGELYAEAKAFLERVGAAQKRQDEFAESVKQVITTYTTLAPALKAWPPLWDLLDEHTKARHKEIKSSPKTVVTPDVDFDKLTAQITAAKLSV